MDVDAIQERPIGRSPGADAGACPQPLVFDSMAALLRITDVVRRTYSSHGVPGLATLGRYYWERGRTLLAGAGRECPLCGWTGRDYRPLMLLDDRYVRASVACPGCGSWERQRAFGPALDELLRAHAAGRELDVLHVSPEGSIANIVAGHAGRYLASNYVNPEPGQLQIDLHDVALPAESLDVVVMSYVLCCVPDDRRAIANLWRVLRPGGMVAACEPFDPGGDTKERPAPRHGGEWRRYGVRDIASRFRPFDVDVRPLVDHLSHGARRRRGVREGERMLVLRKTTA
jgi:SAM-dependent methyltransferase